MKNLLLITFQFMLFASLSQDNIVLYKHSGKEKSVSANKMLTIETKRNDTVFVFMGYLLEVNNGVIKFCCHYKESNLPDTDYYTSESFDGVLTILEEEVSLVYYDRPFPAISGTISFLAWTTSIIAPVFAISNKEVDHFNERRYLSIVKPSISMALLSSSAWLISLHKNYKYLYLSPPKLENGK